jgi:spermidine synthase
MTKPNPDPPADPRVDPPFLPLLLLLFIGSGCAALIYEIVWLQLLQLVIGSTAVSLGVLLGTFMGGMCLGSFLLPRLISAQRHPLRVYALLEMGIGACGFLILFGMPYVEHVYTSFSGHGLSSILLRAAVAALCLLAPTLLMGATLPAIARWVETSRRGVAWLGFFYGGNIAGAVFGCLLAGFYLLRVFDMATATFVACIINVTVALIALALAAPAPYDAPAVSATKAAAPRTPAAWGVYVAIGLSGMSALGAEVVWTRLLSLMLGATVYTFSIILAVFLTGLGIGSTLGAITARRAASPRAALGVCQVLLVGCIGWTAFMVAESLPYWPINLQLSQSPWYTFQLDLARCLWAILPPALLWGASFPIALAAVAARGQDPGRLVGGVYAANTVGAIIGALAFSTVVVPTIGTLGAQRLLLALPVVAAIVTLLPMFVMRRAPEAQPAGVGSAVAMIVSPFLAAALATFLTPVPWGVVAYGRYAVTYGKDLKEGIVPEELVPSGTSTTDTYCTYVGEGMNVSVAVTKTPAGVRQFHGAGKVQASTSPDDMRLQRMLGHISALLHKKPEDVLVVACGAGVTAGTFVVHPEVQHITICDIEPLVPTKVTPMFGKENYHIVDGIAEQNPHMVEGKQVHVVYDDGRHFIRTTREKFDIITSDPIDPWVKGCAALNTVEYYQMCKEHLKPGGVMSLWIPLYESNLETAKSVIATFFQVFPDGIIFSNDSQGRGYDAVLFGQAEPTVINVDQLEARLAREDHQRVKESLQDVGFGSIRMGRNGVLEAWGVAIDLLSTYAGQAPLMQDWSRDAQINTDRNLRLQYLAGMSLNTQMGTAILSSILAHYQFPDQTFVGSAGRLQLLKDALAGAGRGPRGALGQDDQR